MKAYVLHGINDIRLEDINTPLIGEKQVLVKVMAAGICGSDIPRIYQTGAHRHPLVPGHEFSGQVVETGKNVDTSLNNKRVGIFPLIPCKECGPCKNKQYEMCQNYSYLGSRTDGGFAEYVAVPEDNLIELPDNVTYEAAAMLEPMAVAVHSIRKILSISGITDIFDIKEEEKKILKDKTVVVWGLGTIGLLITMFLRDLGIDKLLVIGNKDFQKKQVLSLGISEDDYFDSKGQVVSEWVKNKTEGCGADYIFECVGKNETVKGAIDIAAPASNIVFVGNPYSDMSFDKQLYWKILRSQIKITGTWNSSFTHEDKDDWHYVVDKLAAGEIKPEKLISHRYKLEDLEKGFHIMRDKTEDYVKIMSLN